jgi:acetyl esterase
MSVYALESAPRHVRWRRIVGAAVVDAFFQGISAAGGLLPMAQPARHGVEVFRDIPYLDDGSKEHMLDIYRPLNQTGPLPVVFYVHGGGFRVLSKDTHWMFGVSYAKRGFILVNINYRLSPKHAFPAALEDSAAALEWTVRNIAEYGGDPSRIAFAGESAGANIALSLILATCTQRREPWTKRVYQLDVVPQVGVLSYGLFQVSDPGRFAKKIPAVILDRVTDCTEAYIGSVLHLDPHMLEMADPLLILENRSTKWTRPLPPMFVPCGTWDPLLDDSQRLERVLGRLGVPCDARYYKNEMHAFTAFYALPGARRCWADTWEFMAKYMPAETRAPLVATG